MLQRCSTVCGTEGRDLHASDINAAAVERLSTAKADGRQQLRAAESAVASTLPATRLRGLQVTSDACQGPSQGLPKPPHPPSVPPLESIAWPCKTAVIQCSTTSWLPHMSWVGLQS